MTFDIQDKPVDDGGDSHCPSSRTIAVAFIALFLALHYNGDIQSLTLYTIMVAYVVPLGQNNGRDI